MQKTILVAGATGNLGERIVKALIDLGAEVRVLVRSNSDPLKIAKLESYGAAVFKTDLYNLAEVTKACEGVTCVVSALAGLREVIIDTQKVLLDAAVAAGVPRFIPSDYSLDFTRFSPGENRNLDWRREFHTYLDQQPIAATTIFNGAFADMITGEMPLILFKQKLVLYWGNANHPMSFTTVANVATYTANAAMDSTAPRFLHIAGDLLSPQEIKGVATEVTEQKYRLFRAGGPGLLSGLIKLVRWMAPGETELYPPWQGMQYMRNMIDDRSNLSKSDNDRYPNLHWTKIKDLLAIHLGAIKK